MGDDDDAHAVGTQIVDQPHNLHPGTSVLSEGRFVEQQHLRCGGECGGDGESAFLATGQRVWVDVRVLVEMESPEQVHAPCARLLLSHSRAQWAEHDLVEHARTGELVLGVLEHVGYARGKLT